MIAPLWPLFLVAAGLVTLPFWLALYQIHDADRPKRGGSVNRR
jgi:hypothetical protein